MMFVLTKRLMGVHLVCCHWSPEKPLDSPQISDGKAYSPASNENRALESRPSKRTNAGKVSFSAAWSV